MAVEPNGAPAGLYVALEALRQDVREDIDKMEGRVTGAIDSIRREFAEYGKVHAGEHSSSRSASEARWAAFDTYTHSQEIAQARRDGAIGLVRYGLELGSRHWKLLALLFGAVGLALGNIHLNVGLT